MENVEYNEWVPAGTLVKSLFSFVILIIIVVTFAILIFSKEFLIEDILGISFAWVVLAILALVFWNYRGLQIKINDTNLSVNYGRFDKKSFLLKDITSCKTTKAFGRYLGVGVRVGFDGSLAYTTSFASAVEVTPKVGRVFVFSSNNPQRVCEIYKPKKSNLKFIQSYKLKGLNAFFQQIFLTFNFNLSYMINNSAISKPLGRRFIFSLALAVFGTSMLDVLSSLFLVDLAKNFFGSSDPIYLGIVSQIITISSIAAIVFGVLNGFLSVRIKHRTLLLFGALSIVIGSVGCLLAPNLLFLFIFYPFDGIGTIIVGAMAFTIIGESLPLEKEQVQLE